MKTRKEVAEYINSGKLLQESGKSKGEAWHIGKQELRSLLDFIYESSPNEDEKINRLVIPDEKMPVDFSIPLNIIIKL